MPTGSLTLDQLGRLTKRWAGQGAVVINDRLNVAPEGFLSAFPTNMVDSQYAELWSFKGNPGSINTVLDGPGDTSNWKYVRAYKDMHNSWDKKAYDILDSVQTDIAANRLATDGTQQVLNYFRQTRVHKLLTEMKAKRYSAATHSTAATGGVWGIAGQGRGQQDIVQAITYIVSKTGVDPSTVEFAVAYPSKVMDEFQSLNLINMVVQQLESYMNKAWNLTAYPITPFIDDAGNEYIDLDGTSSNVLSTSALVFVKGDNTVRMFEYRPTDIMLQETARIPGTSWQNIFKQCTSALAVPHDGSENGKNKFVYEITNVTT